MSSSNFKSGNRDTAENMKDDVSNAMSSASSAASDMMSSASDMAGSMRDDATSKIKQGADAAVEQGQKIVENVRDFANRQTATGAKIMDTVSTTANDLAEHVNAGPFGGVIAETKVMVQRNPMAFLLGAMVVGYFAGRAATRSDD